MNTFMYGPSFFSFNHFYYLTSLHVENHCAHLRDIQLKTSRNIFYISAFPTYYSLYNWIGEHEMTKLIKNIYICFESRKKDSKLAQKDMNEMEC